MRLNANNNAITILGAFLSGFSIPLKNCVGSVIATTPIQMSVNAAENMMYPSNPDRIAFPSAREHRSMIASLS